jgi:hypothetical protein
MSVNSEVAADFCANAAALAHANLANNNLADFNFLTTKKLYA